MSTAMAAAPGLSSFLKSLKHADVETSIEHFISYVFISISVVKMFRLTISKAFEETPDQEF
jgi:hypothetical protein